MDNDYHNRENNPDLNLPSLIGSMLYWLLGVEQGLKGAGDDQFLCAQALIVTSRTPSVSSTTMPENIGNKHEQTGSFGCGMRYSAKTVHLT